MASGSKCFLHAGLRAGQHIATRSHGSSNQHRLAGQLTNNTNMLIIIQCLHVFENDCFGRHCHCSFLHNLTLLFKMQCKIILNILVINLTLQITTITTFFNQIHFYLILNWSDSFFSAQVRLSSIPLLQVYRLHSFPHDQKRHRLYHFCNL